MRSWYEEGKKAARTDGWMRLNRAIMEENLADKERKSIHGPEDLVQSAIEGWGGTDHFQVVYGEDMSAEAKEQFPDNEDWIEAYQQAKEDFWGGFTAGSKENPYTLARKLMKPKKTGAVKRPKKTSAPTGTSVRGIR